MVMDIDQNKLNDLLKTPVQPAAEHELRRCGNVFFVGGELPVNETLETMFESFCMESTELFHLTFGDLSTYHRSEEMARQIKKNFHVRLMGRLGHPVSTRVLECIYAAGVDILDIPLLTYEEPSARIHEALLAARPIFPRWSVASTLLVGEGSAASTQKGIDALLKDGIVPLVALGPGAAGVAAEAVAEIFQHLAQGWEDCDVPVQQYLPMISFMMPLVPRDPSGLFRGMFDKLNDRRLLVASDLRRHLRVKTEDSMDSAAL
jgi:hypothetical protein